MKRAKPVLVREPDRPPCPGCGDRSNTVLNTGNTRVQYYGDKSKIMLRTRWCAQCLVRFDTAELSLRDLGGIRRVKPEWIDVGDGVEVLKSDAHALVRRHGKEYEIDITKALSALICAVREMEE